jgi:hypothetical protein
MHLSATSRPTRVRRLLAVSAAAVAVMIAPTACDYGGYSGGSSSKDMGDMGNMPGMDHGAQNPQHPVVVPVANTADASSSGDGGERRSRWRNRPAGNTTTTTSAPSTDPAAAPPTDPAATDPAATDPAATDPAATDPAATDPALPVTDPSAVVAAPAAVPPGAPGDRGPTLPPGGQDKPNNGLDILGRDCNAGVPGGAETDRTQSLVDLPLHTGFQSEKVKGTPGGGVAQCVNTEMGAVAAEDELPSLLIVDSPRFVGMNQAFTLKVSTRNLVRDRFLGAGKGGYYLESSFLNKDGLQRGHFHTACRILDNTKLAPNSGVAPEFFVATEDGGGGSTPDVVTIPVKAIGKPGILQCTSWAGDGSHRTPMMTRANETPAIDSVRIFVTRRDQPVRYDAAAAVADANANIAEQKAQAGAQAPDAKPAAPAAPDAAGTPNAPVDESGAPVDPNAAAAPGDTAPPVADAAVASDAAAPTSESKTPTSESKTPTSESKAPTGN